jgi:hypothetical protein
VPNATTEVTADSFFASRSGVCVYVRVGKQKFRVQFADAEANGVVTGGEREGADEALRVARSALQRHAAELVPLFAKVARSIT